MKKIIPAFIFIFSSLVIHAQTISITWQRSIGGTGDDNGYFIEQTVDGGSIAIGSSTSTDGDVSGNHGSYDILLMKQDNLGVIQWQKSLGGTGIEEGYTVHQTADGGYIISGYSNSNDGDLTVNHGLYDIWIVKTNDTGSIQWQKSYGGSGNERPYYTKQTADGGYIIAGYTESNDGDVTLNHGNADCWVIKINNLGTIQWQKSLGGTGADYGYYISPTPDHGYILTADSYSNDGDVSGNHGDSDCWIAKLDSIGTIQWQKSYGGTGIDYATAAYPTPEGGYIFSAYTNSTDGDVTGNHGADDSWVVKLNSTGHIEWQKCYGGSSDEVNYSFQHSLDGNYIMGGYASSADGDVTGYQGGGADGWIVKIDTAGNLIWQKSIGGTGDDEIFSLQQSSDSSYIVAGITNSTDGDVSGNHGGYDFWTVKLDSVPPVIITSVEKNKMSSTIPVYPNPSNEIFHFSNLEQGNTIEIFDVTGRSIYQVISQNNSCIVDLNEKDKGIYFYKITQQSKAIQQGKLILQ